VAEALAAHMLQLPVLLRRSLTWDRGLEMVHGHAEFSLATHLPVYFCDPHAPWQRGSNENTNGLLRQYFPKGTNLAVHTQADLDAVAVELNGRPRHTLGWATPAEHLDRLLAGAPAA
jgi:transposase, IS30 family